MRTTLNRKLTCLFDDMRNIGLGETEGRFFEWAKLATDTLSDAEYESMVNFYYTNEAKADTGNLDGTDVYGLDFPIKKFEDEYPERPVRPQPLIHRPTP